MRCPTTETDLWFDHLRATEARATCNACPHQMECRRFAEKTMQGNGFFVGTGIYGGHGPLDRMLVRGSNRNVVAAAKTLWRVIAAAPGVTWTQPMLCKRTGMSETRVKTAVELMADSGWLATDGPPVPNYRAVSDVPPWEC